MTETAPAIGTLRECPDLGSFESAPLAPRVHAHVEICDACQLVVELLRAGAESCAQYEPLLAAHADDTLGAAGAVLLERHLATCDTCRAIADEPRTDHDVLPRIDPANYALGVEVGRGGMGRVLAARDLRVGRPVAVKELLGRSRALAARFEREARVTARLQHPGIVPIYEIGRWPDGTPFYTMRMVDGRSLRDAIAATPTLAGRLALLPAVIAATEAIAFAHSQRIIHRDLTPANVMVGAYGETVVIDWGLAKDLVDTSEDEAYPSPLRGEGLTGIGAVLGTAAYMPPEQANAAPVDERADVYALGAILYHVLAGKPPYRAKTNDELLASVKAGPPEPLVDAPRDLASIVAKAMARDAATRYPTARELAEELVRFQTGRVVEAHDYTTLERMQRFIVRNRAALVVTAIALGVLGATGGIAVSRVFRERATATGTVTTLLEEEGRAELVAGHSSRALAYLAEAYRRGSTSPVLPFMLAGPMRELEANEITLDCSNDVREIALSSDGTRLAAACKDVGKIWRLDRLAAAKLWGNEALALVATLDPIPNGYDVIRFSHDGRTVYAGSQADGTVRALDAATGHVRATFQHAAKGRITWLGLTPDDRTLVTTGFDRTAKIWNVATRQLVHTLAAGSVLYAGVHGRLTPDGAILITGTEGGVASGWNVATGEKIGSLDHGSQILGGELSPDSRLGCTPGIDRRVKVWDLQARSLVFTLAGHSDVVWKCVFSPDSKRLVTGGNDGTAKVWDLETGALVTSVDAGDIVWSIAWSPDGRQFATSSLDGSLKVWEAATGALLSSHDDPFGGKAAVFSLDGKRLIAQRGDGRIRIWSSPTGPLLRELEPPDGTTIAAVRRDGSRAVLARGMAGLEVWSTETHERIAHEPIGEPFALADDAILARGHGGTVLIDLGDGHTITELPVTPAAIAIDRRARHAIVRATTGEARLWDLAARIEKPLPDLATALLSPDGSHALSLPDFTVWDLETGTHVQIDPGKNAVPIGFSHDGKRLAIHHDGPGTRLVGVWDDTGGAARWDDRVANDSATFDPEGRFLTTIGTGNVVTVRDLDDGEVQQFLKEGVSRAQVDPTGTLVVAIDKLGSAMLVVSAHDGLTLAYLPIEHPPLSTTEDTFFLPEAAAWWTGRETIVTRSASIAVWDARRERRDAGEVMARVRNGLTSRVRDGRLELVGGELHGHVTRDGDPTAALVQLAIREVPRLPAAMSWSSTMSHTQTYDIQVDDDGALDKTDLLPGEYAVIARSGGATSAVIDVRISALAAELDIPIDRRAAIAGTLRDGAHRPVAGANVVATCSSQPLDTAHATSHADGTFEIVPLAGDCMYDVTVAGKSLASTSAPRGGIEVVIPDR